MIFCHRTDITVACLCAVIKYHDDQSEGLGRRSIVSMVCTASGGKLTRAQAQRTWDKTIFPLGQRLGLLTGYVKPQAGTSKRTAAGAVNLQRDWHKVIDDLIEKITTRAREVLQDERLVQAMLPSLIANLDEECVQAMGKNSKVAGSKSKKKHDNQNSSSRFVAATCLTSSSLNISVAIARAIILLASAILPPTFVTAGSP